MCLFLSSCGILNQNINLEVTPDKYQAFFISLPEQEITPIEKVMEKERIVADFWFEIQDPEIGTMGDEFQGLPHKGQPTQVALVTESDYKDLKKVPNDIEWQNFIKSENLREGAIFLVMASDGNIYKVKLKAFSKSEVDLAYKVLDS